MNANAWLLTLVIAFEPIPLLAGVLLLTTERGRPKAVALACGWALALAIVALLTVIVGQQVSTTSGSTSSKASAVLDIILGVAVGVVALRLRHKAQQGSSGATPGWMKKLDTMSPITAFGLGMFLPPYLIAAAAGNEILREDLSTGAQVVLLVLFVVIGSIGILIPIFVTVLRPSRSDAIITSWRAWLEVNWQAVLTWLLIGIAAYLVVKGVIELFH